MLGQSHLESLAAIVGPGALRAHDVEGTLDPGVHPRNLAAGVVVSPRTTEALSRVVRHCAEHAVSIVPHGGRTGLAGGATSERGQLVVQTAAMSRIVSIDENAGTAEVEAGVTLEQLQAACTPLGWSVGVDLAARGSATIGGMVATNAGGISAFRHGVMRHRVLGLEAVLPDGRVLSDLKRVPKANEGYDVKQLLIGSEGTLGVVTRVVLALVPLGAPAATALVSCADAGRAVRLFSRLRRAPGLDLLAAEILWPDYAQLTAAELGAARVLDFAPEGHVFVVVDVAGRDGDVDALAPSLAAALEAGEVSGAVLAKNERERQQIWAVREESFLCDRRYPHGFWYDVSVPLHDIDRYARALFARIAELDPSLRVFLFGHLGDGNLHLTVTSGREEPERERAVAAAVMDGLGASGGSFSAEHGIGLEKRRALVERGDPVKVDVMRALKRLLDPRGIMNPGKVL